MRGLQFWCQGTPNESVGCLYAIRTNWSSKFLRSRDTFLLITYFKQSLTGTKIFTRPTHRINRCYVHLRLAPCSQRAWEVYILLWFPMAHIPLVISSKLWEL